MHRALVDAETCARVLCALFPRLCANAATVADAVALQGPRRPARRREPRARSRARRARPRRRAARSSTSASCPAIPACTCSATGPGPPCTSASRSRSRAAPGLTSPRRPRRRWATGGRPDWRRHATVVDYRATNSELGALVLENRLIKELRPPGNIRLAARDDRLVYIRCRLDIPFPILDVAARAGRPATRCRSGRCAAGASRSSSSSSSTRCSGCATAGASSCCASTRRPTGRWAAACRRAWAIWTPTCTAGASTRRWRCSWTGGDGAARLLAHVEAQMREAAAQQRYERAPGAAPAGRAPARDRPRPGRDARGHPCPPAAADRLPSHGRPPRLLLGGGRPRRRLGRRCSDAEELQARTERGADARAASGRARRPCARPPRSTSCGSWPATSPRTPTCARSISARPPARGRAGAAWRQELEPADRRAA